MSREKRRRRFRIVRRKFGAAVLPYLAPTLLRQLSRSWKVNLIGEENL